MALVETDWSVALNGDIRYIGAAHGVAGASYATTIELHRYLQDKADDASALLDDLVDITSDTPSDRLGIDNIIQLLGIYNLDTVGSEHVYDGSIIQGAVGTTQKIYDGFVNYGNAGVNIQLMQDGAYIVNDFWNETVNGASTSGLNADASNGISHRFMVLVHDASVDGDIDGRRLIGITREYGKTYKEFKVNGTARGNNTLALDNVLDGNNTTSRATIDAIADIINTEGFNSQDTDIDGTPEDYYGNWTRGENSINTFVEYIKAVCAYDSAKTLYGLDGKIFRGITHEIDVDTATGTFAGAEELTWGTGATAGVGQLLAIDSPTAGTKLWIQLLTGVVPSDGVVITGATSGATVTMNLAIIERPISFIPAGSSTGTALNGGYGFGVLNTDLTASDKLVDLTNSTIQPPDYRQTSVTGLDDGESRVLVAPDNGGLMNDQFQLQTTVVADAGTVILESNVETLGTATQSAKDTPSAGQFRLYDDAGVSHVVSYTSYTVEASTMTFLGCTNTPAATALNNAFISYTDELVSGTSTTFTSVYHSPRTLYVRVRDGGTVNGTPVKTFFTTLSLGSSTSAVLTADI
ncbi:MAG: hypothetical protein U9Q38_06685 [Thermodesulfobacteriota bacterium]|nr:hypothetical protein [Thermodesulfobacteriota bacterium]